MFYAKTFETNSLELATSKFLNFNWNDWWEGWKVGTNRRLIFNPVKNVSGYALKSNHNKETKNLSELLSSDIQSEPQEKLCNGFKKHEVTLKLPKG